MNVGKCVFVIAVVGALCSAQDAGKKSRPLSSGLSCIYKSQWLGPESLVVHAATCQQCRGNNGDWDDKDLQYCQPQKPLPKTSNVQGHVCEKGGYTYSLGSIFYDGVDDCSMR